MPTVHSVPAISGPTQPLRLVKPSVDPSLAVPATVQLIMLVRAIAQRPDLVSPDLAIYLPTLINMMEVPVDLDSRRGWLLGEFAEKLAVTENTGTPAMQAAHRVLSCGLIIARHQPLTPEDVSTYLAPHLGALPRLPEITHDRRGFMDAQPCQTRTAHEILYPSRKDPDDE